MYLIVNNKLLSKLGCITGSLAVFIIATFLFKTYTKEIIFWINSLSYFAPIIFIIIYCLATVLFLPTMVLTLAGGALFGPLLGTLFNLIGATCGALCSFLITRYLFNFGGKKIKGIRLKKLIAQVNKQGWPFVALLRLVPILPFNLINYGLGLTNISFKLYALTTLVFLIPAEIIYTYCGYISQEVLSQSNEWYKSTNLIYLSLIILLVILMFSIKIYTNRTKVLTA